AAGGDLLLRGGRRRDGVPAGVRHPGTPDRRAGRGAHRRRGARPARLARAVDGRAGVRPVLPQRDGRPGRPARMADLRRPGSRLGARHLGRPAGGPATSDGEAVMSGTPNGTEIPGTGTPSANGTETPSSTGSRTGTGNRTGTVRLTVAQALVRFLANQWSERDGVERRLVAGCFGIFGHGNVAGVGQALLEAALPGAGPDGSGSGDTALGGTGQGGSRSRSGPGGVGTGGTAL